MDRLALIITKGKRIIKSMAVHYTKTILWIIKVQWKTSKIVIFRNFFMTFFDGLFPIATAYTSAKTFAALAAVALQRTNPNSLYFWLVLLVLLELIQIIINNLNYIITERFEQSLGLTLYDKFYKKLYQLSQQQFDDEAFNTKVNRANESFGVSRYIFRELSGFASSIVQFVASLSAIAFVAPVVGLISVVVAIPITIFNVRNNNRREKMYKTTDPTNRLVYRTRWLLGDPNFMAEIRLMNAFKYLLNSHNKNLKKVQDITYAEDKRRIKYDLISEASQPLVTFGASIYFIQLLIKGVVGLDRVTFLRQMFERVNSSTVSIIQSIKSIHMMLIDLSNFGEVNEAEPAIPNGKQATHRPMTIEFQNVSFTYPGSEKEVLKDISFTIKPGDKIAIVGENGAGKTTLIKLLLRQYLPTSGRILVNGIDIADIEREGYCANISNLSQEFLLIDHLTILDNLQIGLTRPASENKIHKSLKMANAETFIEKLPQGLQTRLDPSFDDGTNLSGGQKQRLAVARALLNNGDILILDEPTSAIDAKAEYTIFKNIYESQAEKTTLIVSHRFSTIRKANTIMVMDHGQITEVGPHEELINNSGLYKEMFDRQAEGYK